MRFRLKCALPKRRKICNYFFARLHNLIIRNDELARIWRGGLNFIPEPAALGQKAGLYSKRRYICQNGTKNQLSKAKQYLSKMFQVDVELSPTEGQMREFFNNHLPLIPYPENTPEERKKLFRRVILRLASRNPRELKRNFNGALMAAVGVKFIKRKKDQPEFTFEQGLQSFFVRRIVQTQFPSLAEMPDTDKGRNFFMDWSRLLIELTREQQIPDRQGRPAETED